MVSMKLARNLRLIRSCLIVIVNSLGGNGTFRDVIAKAFHSPESCILQKKLHHQGENSVSITTFEKQAAYSILSKRVLRWPLERFISKKRASWFRCVRRLGICKNTSRSTAHFPQTSQTYCLHPPHHQQALRLPYP